ncbi:hypothetical protein GCM10023116_00930 [Kistimonas scapharcae]|uniref:Uncharacterized protein n=1 Tax=Kistimonas scapharcae TaxID=1036133 RepID=A0ABP8UVC1_9GAMM
MKKFFMTWEEVLGAIIVTLFMLFMAAGLLFSTAGFHLIVE